MLKSAVKRFPRKRLRDRGHCGACFLPLFDRKPFHRRPYSEEMAYWLPLGRKQPAGAKPAIQLRMHSF